MNKTWAISGFRSRFVSALMPEILLTAEARLSQRIGTFWSLTFACTLKHTPASRRHRFMTTRTFAAGILGGIAMFIWTSVAHLALPLGEAGVREIPNEQAALAPLQQNIGEKEGLYLFPGLGLSPNPTGEQRRE